MNTREFFQVPFAIPAIILSIGLILSAFVGALAFYKVRTLDNTLVVTGSAKTNVTADSAKWSFSISRRVFESGLTSGYGLLASDLNKTRTFLHAQGVTEEEITIAPVFVEEIYKYEPNQAGPREFTLRQMIIVSSPNVDKITALANTTAGLASQNVFVTANAPEYFYTKLSELRVSLLANAIKDARARAEQIANSSGQSVGELKSAQSGVVQVLAPNSIDVADFGQYDTSTVEKEIMITVRATFFVR